MDQPSVADEQPDDARVPDSPTLPFDAWLAAELQASGLTAQRLARLAGVDRSMVWRLLHGQRRPSVEVAARIAVALESTRPTVGPERRTDVIGRVQHELAADPFLKPRDIRRVMSHYARLRAGIGSGSSSAGGSFATGEQPAAVEAGSLPPTP